MRSREHAVEYWRTISTMRIAVLPFVLILLLATLIYGQPAQAQPAATRDAGAAAPATSGSGFLSSAEAAQAEARTEMREGISAFDNRDYDNALRRFRRAMELVPEANLPHRYAAKALEALSRWEEAVTEHQEYLRIKPDVSDAQAVRDRIEELRRLHLTGTVVLRCDPEPTEISVDGSPVTITVPPSSTIVSNSTSGSELRLLKGPHRIVVGRPLPPGGHVARSLDVVVVPNTTITPDCKMESASSSPAPAGSSSSGQPFQPIPNEQPRSPWYGRWYTWVGAGVVVAGGILATILIVGAQTNPPPATEGGNHTFP